MPSVASPHGRRSLGPSILKSALSTSKAVVLSDTPTPTSSTRGPRAPLPSSIAANVRCISWSPLGNLLAVADTRSLRVWNPEKPGLRYSTELKPGPLATPVATGTGRPPPPPQHMVGTETVAWNPAREAELAGAGNDGIVRFWDVRSRGACVGEIKIGGEAFSMAWKPDGEELVVSRKDDMVVIISRSTLKQLSTHQQSVQTNQIAFSNSGNEIFLTTGDSQVKILDYPSMTHLHTLTPHTSSCYSVLACPRGRYLAIGGSDALITLWDTRMLTCRHAIADMTGPIRCLSFSFDGSYIIAGSDERNEGVPASLMAGGPLAPSSAGSGTSTPAGSAGPAHVSGINIYHVESGECVHTIPASNPAPCVAWHPSRYSLAYSGEVGGVKIIGAGGGSVLL